MTDDSVTPGFREAIERIRLRAEVMNYSEVINDTAELMVMSRDMRNSSAPRPGMFQAVYHIDGDCHPMLHGERPKISGWCHADVEWFLEQYVEYLTRTQWIWRWNPPNGPSRQSRWSAEMNLPVLQPNTGYRVLWQVCKLCQLLLPSGRLW